MATDIHGLADVVILTLKSAMAPLLERVAVLEQVNRDLQARVEDVAVMRDRLVTVETKMAAPVVEPAPTVDLSPALERIATLEAQQKALGDVRDRVVTIEAKSASVAAVDAPDVKEELRELRDEIREHVRAIPEVLRTSTDYRNRLESLEAKTAQPVVIPAAGPSVAEQELALVNRLEPVVKQLAALSERQAALEARPAVPGAPGPAGEPGRNGSDGKDGKDGVDGLGFDDLVTVQEDDRSVTIKAVRGDLVKTIGTARFPVEMYRGVYLDGKTYERGDCCTWAGSEWHANETTTTKPGETKAWTLKVKRGRDGRDGRDALQPVPVVSIGRK